MAPSTSRMCRSSIRRGCPSLNNARKSGFLTPTLGSSSSSGLTLSAPYYWNIAPNMDATISPRIYSKRVRRWRPSSATSIRISPATCAASTCRATSRRTTKIATPIRYVTSRTSGRASRAPLNIAGVSDDDYFTDLSSRSVLTSQRQLLRQGVLSYGAPSGGWWSATMIDSPYQTLNPDSTTSQHIDKVYSLAPQVNPVARRPEFLGRIWPLTAVHLLHPCRCEQQRSFQAQG